MSNIGPNKEASRPLGPLSATRSPFPASPHHAIPPIPKSDCYDPGEFYRSHQEWSGQGRTKRASRLSNAFTPASPVEQPPAHHQVRPWWMLGYERRSSVALFVFFGGAILGFSLSRTPMLSFKRLLKLTVPGEGYWYEQPPYKASIIIHIFLNLAANFFSVFCFLPITFNRWPKFHRILGYIVSPMLFISMVCGAIVGRRAQGGDLDVQAGVYMVAFAAAFAVVVGCLKARQGAFHAHREWMLRAWFYNGVFITTRVTALLSAQAITAINSYYALWQCAEVGYVLKTPEALARAFPQCPTSGPLANVVHVAIHASWKEGRLGKASASRASFGMALWVAMILHFVGIELYLRVSRKETKWWREWSKHRTSGREQTEPPHQA